MAGARSRVDAVVTEEMVATLGGRAVHPVLATARMIEWMEWAGRRLILPYLEPEEDAVGHAIDVVHLRPTRVGSRFWAIAEWEGRHGTKLLTRVAAYNDAGLIGEGRFIQALIPRTVLERAFGAPQS
ncbi:MAG: thioesterase family protein [Clostridia bacterium]